MPGCCGQSRFRDPSFPQEARDPTSPRNEPERRAPAQPPLASFTIADGAVVVHRASTTQPPRFRYVGVSALSVMGPRTGQRYRFDSPGAEVIVHPLDAPMLSAIPKLRRL